MNLFCRSLLKEAVSTKDSDYTQFLGLVRVCPGVREKKLPDGVERGTLRAARQHRALGLDAGQ